jgi:hypothetical protein
MFESSDRPHRAFLAAVAAIVAGLAANCGGHTTTTGPTSGVTPVSLKINGPIAIAPGQTVSFVAVASMSNGTTEDYTRKVTWSVSPTSLLTITQEGVATGQSVGDATISALFQPVPCCHAQVSVTVLPTNTYRLTGRVLESGLEVPGAAITVLSGIGTGLSTTTDYAGGYRLYGVAGVIQVKFSKPGYDDIVKTFTAVQNDVLDFPEAHQTAAIPSITGTYSLTLTADPGCSTVTVSRVAPLPDDFRHPRTYTLSLTQDGPVVTATVTDPAIDANENRFGGRVGPDSIDFQIGYGYWGYGFSDGVAEKVSATQEFVFGGQLHVQRAVSGTGRLDGALEVYTLAANVPAYNLTGQCIASNNQVTLTRAAQPARRR